MHIVLKGSWREIFRIR